ncbi:MAG: hypothetical protein AAB685_02405 [Patescibacteria group bacterium]
MPLKDFDLSLFEQDELSSLRDALGEEGIRKSKWEQKELAPT